MSDPLVMIGNGMAATRLVDEITKRSLGRYAIAVIGEEPRLAYNRVLLSAVLAREVHARTSSCGRHVGGAIGVSRCCMAGQRAQSIPNPARAARRRRDVALRQGCACHRFAPDPAQRPGHGAARCDDVPRSRRCRQHRSGCTTARAGRCDRWWSARARGRPWPAKAGVRVTILHLMDRLMERQLDAHGASMLKRAVEARGIAVQLNAETVRIRGRGRAQSVVLKDGKHIEADLVVVAAGIRPNVELAHGADLGVDRGILVDDHLQTSRPGIYAIGECAEHRGVCYGLVEPACEQARVLAAHLAGEEAHYPGSVLATNLKVSGVNVFSAGDFLGAPGTEQLVLSDPGLGTCKKFVIRCGDSSARFLLAIPRTALISRSHSLWHLNRDVRDDIMFGRALAERKAA